MLEKLAELIKEQLNYDGEVKAESNFKDDLGADSLDLFSYFIPQRPLLLSSQ